MSDFQDWKTIVFKKKPVKKVNTSTKVAAGTGQQGYQTVRTQTGKTNNASPIPKVNSSRLRKLDNDELPTLPKVTPGMKAAIVQGRQLKNMTQKDLAEKLSVKPSIIQDYESGKCVPNSQFISRMERVLEVKINGK